LTPGAWKRLRNRWAVFAHDLLWVPVAIYFAFWLRFNLEVIPHSYLFGLYTMLLVSVPVQALLFWRFGLYRGIWRFASIPDHVRILKTALLGTLVTTITLFAWHRLHGVPRSVLLLYPMLLVVGIATPRVFYRWLKDHHLRFGREEGQKALVVGAGQAADLLLRDLLRRPEYHPVAVVDDDPAKRGKDLRGLGVLGTLEEIPQIVEQMSIEVVLLAIPSAASPVVNRVVGMCTEAGVPCRTLPSLVELAGGNVAVSRLRPVTVEDLLGREPVTLDIDAIAAYLHGKKVLVTGGGGSIGSELCRQVAAKGPGHLIVLDSSELNLFLIERDLAEHFPELHFDTVLADIRNRVRIPLLFDQFRPQVVFHAAALKHVPMVEANPEEAVQVNVLGTSIVADAAVQSGCGRFVLISTDKAVNPANVMGATKRVAEIYCQNLDRRSATCFITTRFGNVLDSSGSVVPLFAQQIAKGGPVTVTHPQVTRYFMTIPEAVGLILQAGSMGKGGEIFILDMGHAVKIQHLAEQMIRLSGMSLGRDIEIVYTGLRPGEKLFEELFHEQEALQPTGHRKILLAGHRTVQWQQMLEMLQELGEYCERYELDRVRSTLRKLVPEYGAVAAAPLAGESRHTVARMGQESAA
jgi:FlaA1/EpsC-like NDP-sugar epimerase